MGTTLSITADFSVGVHSLTLTVTDNAGTTGSDAVVVTVNEPITGISVTGIDPNAMQLGTTINVTITGSDFVGGADVDFKNGEGPSPTASNVVVVDANTMTATVTAKNGGPPRNRLWDVV